MIKIFQFYWDNLLKDHPALIMQTISLLILGYGIYLIVAAIKNWNEFRPNLWFESDDNLQGISRIWGRNWARFRGFCIGLFILIPLGGFLIFESIIKPLLK